MNRRIFIAFVASLGFMMGAFGSANAQEAGDMAVGVDIVFTPKWVFSPYYKDGAYTNNAGVGAKFQYNVTTPIRVEGAFIYLPVGDKLGLWYLSASAQYLIPVVEKLKVYPVAGFDLMRYTVVNGAYIYIDDVVLVNTKVAGKHTIFGVHFGGGAECKLSKKVSLQDELRYIIGFNNTIFSDYFKTNRLMISLGAVYRFSAQPKPVLPNL